MGGLSRKKIIIIFSVFLLIGVAITWYLVSSKTPTATPFLEDDIGVVPVVSENNDDIRIRHLDLIAKSITTALTRGFKLPLPDKSLEIKFLGKSMVFQGLVPPSLYDSLGLYVLLDPVTQEPYRYAISPDGSKYQFFARLDDIQRGNTQIDNSIVYSIGEPGLFILNSKGRMVTPLQVDGESVDLADSSARKKMGFDTLKSCLDIYNFKNSFTTLPKSGAYMIDVGGRDTKVFCDMQTDGGGWTLFYANNGHKDSPIAKSYVEMRETMSTQPVLDLGQYDDPNLAGLLDFTHFTSGLNSREILIRNRAGDVKKWVKFTFSTSRALEWALGPFVLGKTIYGCIDLPRRDTWNVSNNGGLIYSNLRQIMNHGGLNWGISHEKYICNGFVESKNPHIGFYSAIDSDFSNRARSNDNIGGKWGDKNEYRYFIR